MNPYVSTLLHVAELVVILIVVGVLALASQKFFGLDLNSYVKEAAFVVLAGVVKLARADSGIAIPDYVNGSQS